MAKKSNRKKKQAANKQSEQQDAEIQAALSTPWIQQRSGLVMMVLLSLGFAAFMAWQLYPTEGVGRALMWGIGSAVVLWLIFLLGVGFNKLVRR